MTNWPALVEIAPARPAQGDRPLASPVYRPAYAKDGHSALGFGTLLEMFEQSVKKFGNRPCLGHRPMLDGTAQQYEFITYNEAADLITALGSAYAGLGLEAKDRIGVIGQNSPEYMIAMQAMNRMDMVCVPLYDTLGEDAVQYIVQHSEAKLVLSSGAKLASLVKALAKTKDVITCGVAYWGTVPAEAVQAVKDLGYQVFSWEELLAKGRAKPMEPATRPAPEDLCTIMYTSGTTGDPKGVMISHRAVLGTIAGIRDLLTHCQETLDCNDVYLSFLPLAHIFDRVVEELMLSIGGSVGYFQGDVRKLTDDIAALRPTVFCGVPRVFERIYNGIQAQVESGGAVKKMVFNWAFDRKLHYMKQGWRHDQASLVSDMLVFNKIKQKLGGRVRVIVSGGAPLSPAIEEFLKVAMCAPMVQGYGLTETCAASFIQDPYKPQDHMGTVGPPLSHTELRLEAVPDMGYSPDANPPSGEVCIRGTGVFTSYYKNEEMTKASLDAEGFFHTGDIGVLAADGSLKIIDRKKNIFKLSHGEYIAVEKLENVYSHCPVVEQIWVYGNSMESVLVAVVVPASGPAKQWAADNSIEKGLQDLCQDAAFKAHVLAQLRATGKAAKLKGFEDIKAVQLEPEAFSVDNDLMTPKFSLKRVQLQKRYQGVIDQMYKDVKASMPPAV